MPIVSVTPLGSSVSGTGGAIDQIIDYLQRGAQRPEPNSSIAGYYADTPTSAGVWRGRGVDGLQLAGPIAVEQFRSVLGGRHPLTNELLVQTVGSASRADAQRSHIDVPPNGPPDELLSSEQVAALLHTSDRYVRKVAVEQQLPANARHAALPGQKNEQGDWMFRRDDVERFASTRREQKVVVAYDVTVSFEKSISLAWARSTPEHRKVIEAALDAGTNAAVAYLEDQALAVRRGRGTAKADGVWAASYRHLTNRNLEPQLHDHVVIANIGAANRRTQALDSRLLHYHAKTAGYVAGAVTRQHLTEHLGVAWQPVERGLADIEGVTRKQVNAFSTRRAEITTLTDELGLESAAARTIAALATRQGKQHPTDWDALENNWHSLLDDVGLSTDRWQQLQTQTEHRDLTVADETNVLKWLDSPVGVTRDNGVFSRKDVVQSIIDWDGFHGPGTRLGYDTIDRLTDFYLTGQSVVALDMTSAQITRTGETNWYTTTAVLNMERAVIGAYTNSHQPAPTTLSHVATAISDWEHQTGHTLGDDQAAMVQAITTRTDQFMAVVGPAGSGKTAALEVAARAFEQAGYTPIGASVTGTATEVLEAATGMQTRTVASLLAELDNSGQPFGSNTVLIVDEASTLANRDHHQLIKAITEAGAIMRTIGDPAQHRSVEAGGLWAHLVNDLGDRVPTLETNRRQAASHMTDVKLANADYRNGHIAQALQRLDTNNRIITATSAPELLDRLAADWYVDRTTETRESRMMAESHTVRRQLNQRAQALLIADGTLTGAGIAIGGERLHVGDQVITRTQDRTLRFNDGHFLRNAATGTITGINTNDTGRPEITVAFDRHGTLTIPHDFLVQQIRTGVEGGLAPAYAITTHAAQGATYAAGRMIATDTSTREGIYVGLTRGTSDARIYLVSRDDLDPTQTRSDVGLPILTDTRETLDKLATHLNAPEGATVAAATDPNAENIHVLRAQNINELRQQALTNPAALRALHHAADSAARDALHRPSAELIDKYGERPPANSPLRPAWDDVIRSTVQQQVTQPLVPSGKVEAALARFEQLRPGSSLSQDAGHDQAEVVTLAQRLKTARSILPLDDKLIAKLDKQLETHIGQAVDKRSRYLADVLGERPESDEKSTQRWDKAATSIERWRHRQGITPDHGAFEGDTPLRRATGPTESNRHEVTAITKAVTEHLEGENRSVRRGRSR